MTSAPATSPRIVVGIDGSTSSLDALSWAARQADLTAARLEVVMTWEWPSSLGWAVPVPEGLDPAKEVRQTIEKAVAPVRTAHPGLIVEEIAQEGHPAPVLVEASKGADLLVVGSRGHGEFVGMLIGSVSEYCAEHAACPVLVHRTA